MMALVKDEVRLCQVKAYHTDMTVVSLCMAANVIDTQMCPNLALKVVDEMHSLVMLFLTQLTQVTVNEGLVRGL